MRSEQPPGGAPEFAPCGPLDREPRLGERGILTAHGVRPLRRFGQNFLLDPRIPRETVRRAAWTCGTPVIEIGAGGGALTVQLLAAGMVVTAVEIDARLIAVLEERFAIEIAQRRLRLIAGDILKLPLKPLLAAWPEGGSRPDAPGEPTTPTCISGADPAVPPFRPWIAGNLPYGVTTPILLRLLAHAQDLDGAVLMVQREYGERLLAHPGESAYSSISVRTAAQARARQLLLAGRSAFWPRPGVESLVVELTFPRPAPYIGSIRALERVLRAGFGQRRKTLENALSHGLGWTKPDARARLEQAGCDPGARAETLPLERFAALAALVEAESE